MKTHTLFVRSAPLAIAASLALSFTAASAQDATTASPPIVLPPVQSTPEVAETVTPTIVLPETVTEPAAVEVAPSVAAAPSAEVRQTHRRQAAAPATVSMAETPAISTVESAPAPSSNVSETQAAAAIAATVAPVPVEAETTPPPISNTDVTGELAFAATLGALGLGAVGGIALLAKRRRRRGEHSDAFANEPDATAVTPQTLTSSGSDRESSAAIAPATPIPARPVYATGGQGDPIALPATMPESFEERDALLKALVAAEPDRANPFTSPRARARRAKLIMQSLDRSFRSRKPRIDLSEYTNRWPSLRGWQPATA